MTEKTTTNEYSKKSFDASSSFVNKYSDILGGVISVQYGVDLLRLSIQDNILRQNGNFTDKDLIKVSRDSLKPKIEQITRLLNTEAMIDAISPKNDKKSINPQLVINIANLLTSRFLPQILGEANFSKDNSDPIKDFLNKSDFFFKSDELKSLTSA